MANSRAPNEPWPPDQLTGYYGRVAQAWFTTATDLNTLLPRPLVTATPHRGFLKVYQLKSAKVGGQPHPPAFSQYRQVCISVLAAPEALELRHYNLFMWEDRAWASRAGGIPSWNKKQADIEMTWMFPVEDRFTDIDRVFVADVTLATDTILHFESVLDGIRRIDPPPLSGFYCDGDDGALYVVPLRETYLGEPLNGHGSLTFGEPNQIERHFGRHPSMLGPVEVEGVTVQDVYFARVFSDLYKVELPTASG